MNIMQIFPTLERLTTSFINLSATEENSQTEPNYLVEDPTFNEHHLGKPCIKEIAKLAKNIPHYSFHKNESIIFKDMTDKAHPWKYGIIKERFEGQDAYLVLTKPRVAKILKSNLICPIYLDMKIEMYFKNTALKDFLFTQVKKRLNLKENRFSDQESASSLKEILLDLESQFPTVEISKQELELIIRKIYIQIIVRNVYSNSHKGMEPDQSRDFGRLIKFYNKLEASIKFDFISSFSSDSIQDQAEQVFYDIIQEKKERVTILKKSFLHLK